MNWDEGLKANLEVGINQVQNLRFENLEMAPRKKLPKGGGHRCSSGLGMDAMDKAKIIFMAGNKIRG